MKEYQKGFVGVIIVIAAALIVIGSLLIYASRERTPATDGSETQGGTGEPAENPPKITTVTPESAKIGAMIEVRGENLAGFEGDKNLWIEKVSGERGIIYGMRPDSTDKLIRFKLADKYCSIDTSYSGLPCPSYLTVLHGEYEIFANPWGKVSNKIKFKVNIPIY